MLMVSWFVCGVLYFYLYAYLFCTIVCKEKFEVNKLLVFLSIIMSILQCVIMNYGLGYIKPYLMHLLSFFMLKALYKQKFIKTLLGLLMIFVLIFISELLFGIIFVLILKIDFSVENVNYLYYTLSNMSIFIICYFISKIRLVKNLFNNVLKWYNKNEYTSLVFFVFLFSIIMTFTLYNNFIIFLPRTLLFVANLFSIAVFIFVIEFFKEKAAKNKLVHEYDNLLEYTKAYERLLDEKSKKQHEYKNQLAVIKLMANTKKINDYINQLLEEDLEEDLEIINKLKYIPKGGLKGLIYYKVETMKKKNLNIFIDVSSTLINSKLWNRCDKNLESVSKVLGVYLDNAIEASENSSEKYIMFEVFLENKNIVFKISNTFSNKLDMNKVDKEGYTTKGSGKGYGLALAKDIINKNEYLEQAREISGIYYIQKLYIKK